jgi:hypothetical protein
MGFVLQTQHSRINKEKTYKDHSAQFGFHASAIKQCKLLGGGGAPVDMPTIWRQHI